MKKYLLLIAYILAFGHAFAQDEIVVEKTPIKLRAEVGIQTNALFGRLSNDAENGLVQNPYLLVGKLGLGNLAIRLGVGGQHDKQVDKVEGFANTTTTTKQRLDLRLGIERQFQLADRWVGTFGVDAVADWTQDKTVEDSGFDVITETNDLQYIGGGLAAGVKYQISRRLSIGTEGFVYYTAGKITMGEFFKNFPVGEDKTQESDISNLKIGLPAALYLNLEF
jgi:hypothetical protein